jgi:hypothetical protein
MERQMEEKEERGFVLKDRRKISMEDTEPEGISGESQEEVLHQETKESPEEPARGQREESRGPLPQVTFSTLIFSFSSSALVHLGEIPEPETQTARVDLPMAKQVIDTLGLLQEKTKGNLEPEEDQLLKGVLYDLRLRYLQKSGQ